MPLKEVELSSASDASLEEKHRHALILGEGTLFECSTMTVGLPVMAPNLCYPFHPLPLLRRFIRR
ncbi:dimethylsulfonioproprionate lyase family protein [Pseudomonas sp. QTF5]|uniref:dimethylsulfonioproprionate lyase family protein n=1 Tax=Pseudomonas sp. QTF5 TaxID=1435425 RepID=UPI0009DC9A5E